MKPFHARLVGAAAFFVVAAVALTGVALFVSAGRDMGWMLIHRGEARFDSAPAERSARHLSFGLLAIWEGARGKPPEAVSRIDGTPVELTGHARPEGDAPGLWIVPDPMNTLEEIEPPMARRVWIALPEGKKGSDLVERGMRLRAHGILRVGVAGVPGARRKAAYRIELGTLEKRARIKPREDGHSH